MKTKYLFLSIGLFLIIQGCKFSYSHHFTRDSPDWWENKQITTAKVYEIIYNPTMIKFKYNVTDREFNHYVYMSQSFLMPATASYDLAYNPDNPKENVILLHKPHFYDDEDFIYTVGTASVLETEPHDVFARGGRDSSFIYYVRFQLEDGRKVPRKYDGLLQIQPYSPSYYSMYEKEKKYLLMYSPKEWTRCWMFLDYPVDGLSDAEIKAKTEELKQNNYMLRKRP